MLRTIIEHKENNETWEPAYPTWFGEAADPVFAYLVEHETVPDLIAAGATVVTDRLPEYKREDLNVDGTADWYYASVEQLLASEQLVGGRMVLKGMLMALQMMSEENGCPLDHLRVMFYRPLLLDIR